ncbi:hypothetical protein GTY67_34385 [Streptomyces sp. SID8374]|uniref:hypothetical protein n=1 Tax=Streptomyces sp. SID8374 TaxID=2690354 RepID=UPI00136D9703|nr:hypothetical protein [Streptomyces sp. SID8374]MYX18439.1 hypothetical protein [Streptomyces sp. SID8374]
MPRLTRAARSAAACALYVAHTLLILWAASAAAAFSWRSGYTLPYDTGDNALLTCAAVFALLAGGAVATLPEPWIAKARHALKGSPMGRCPACDGPVPAAAMVDARPGSVGPVPIFDSSLVPQNGEKTHPKETR